MGRWRLSVAIPRLFLLPMSFGGGRNEARRLLNPRFHGVVPSELMFVSKDDWFGLLFLCLAIRIVYLSLYLCFNFGTGVSTEAILLFEESACPGFPCALKTDVPGLPPLHRHPSPRFPVLLWLASDKLNFILHSEALGCV